jgi:putative membrane protein
MVVTTGSLLAVHLFEAFGTTVARRPYVLAFLVAFLVIGWLNRGAGRTLLLLLLGFAVTFPLECVSIRWGFPFGVYHYHYDTLAGELVWLGVPLWSSLSFSFVAYAAWETADFLGWRWRVLGGAVLMTLADVAIDPVTLQGERWFLGSLYHYPGGGSFFGVPWSNFAGWFLVGVCILGSWTLAERRLVQEPPSLRAPGLGPALYYGIVVFILVIGLVIGEYVAVVIATVLHAPIVLAVLRAAGRDRRSENSGMMNHADR